MKDLPKAILLGLVLIPTSVHAERNLVPTLENTPDFCIDRPELPEWVRNIDIKEAHKGVLLQDIYRFQNMQRIVEGEECSCGTQFPSWDAAQEVYFERYANSERWEIIEASSDFSRKANELRRTAKPICEAEGNW